MTSEYVVQGDLEPASCLPKSMTTASDLRPEPLVGEEPSPTGSPGRLISIVPRREALKISASPPPRSKLGVTTLRRGVTALQHGVTAFQ